MDKIPTLSLGENCFPRRFIDMYSLSKKSIIPGPFDNGGHPYDAICTLLENDFYQYTDRVIYDYKNFKPPRYRSLIYNIEWGHENDSKKNMSERIDEFKAIVNVRVNMFKHWLKIYKRINFVMGFEWPKPDPIFDSSRIVSVLNKKYPELDYKIFIVYNRHKNRVEKINGKTKYINIPLVYTEEFEKEFSLTKLPNDHKFYYYFNSPHSADYRSICIESFKSFCG